MQDCLKCGCTGYIVVKFARAPCPVCKGKGFIDNSPFKTTNV